jgi:hypothetical protein
VLRFAGKAVALGKLAGPGAIEVTAIPGLLLSNACNPVL